MTVRDTTDPNDRDSGQAFPFDGQPKHELAADGSFSCVEADQEETEPLEPSDPEKISIDPRVVSVDTLIRRHPEGRAKTSY